MKNLFRKIKFNVFAGCVYGIFWTTVLFHFVSENLPDWLKLITIGYVVFFPATTAEAFMQTNDLRPEEIPHSFAADFILFLVFVFIAVI